MPSRLLTVLTKPPLKRTARNDPCPCGSGKKYKHCCQRKDLGRTTNVHSPTAFISEALQTAIQHHQSGRLTQAQAICQQIVQAKPSHSEALHLLGLIYHCQGNSDVAVGLIRRAIKAKPSEAMYYFNLGHMRQDMGQLDEASTNYRRALLLKPDDADTYCNLATVLLIQGQVDEAVVNFRKALLLKPDDAAAYSRLLFAQNLGTCPPAEAFSAHQRYAERFEAPLKPFWQPHPNNRDPERRLKVGYVSGDFCSHVVAYFLEPILACHDKSAFQIHGYYNNIQHDGHTERIARHMDHFLACHGLSDEQLAERIRADGIDILVDLSGHTGLNRLPVFARKPAPVQVNWIGYPGSTGLSAMDYRISDPWQDPP
ncbi:MAG: tetratricopeptide repeat protein, partial [Sulfuritalea sp.]|nr:tetratricopeptide repeat protein [Sulfuritalea sp.]